MSILKRARAFLDGGASPLRADDLARLVDAVARVDGEDISFDAWRARIDRRGRRNDAIDSYSSAYRTDAQQIESLRSQHAHFVAGYATSPKLDARAQAYARVLGDRVRLVGDTGSIGPDGDVDPDDLDHSAARGANAAVASASEMPDVANLDLGQVKMIAAALGAYATPIRARLAAALLARLCAVGAAGVANAFSAAWSAGGITAPSDDESERAATASARGDASLPSEFTAAQRLRQVSNAAWQRRAPAPTDAPTEAPGTGPVLDDEASAKAKFRQRGLGAHRKTRRTAGEEH